MSPRTKTLPPTDGAMWRRLLARAHPDAGGDHDLFIWTEAVKDVVCGGDLQIGPKSPHPRSSPPAPDETARIPYAAGADFQEGAREALRIAEEIGTVHVYGALLATLADCEPFECYAYRQERGSSYRQLAAIGHTVGMSKEERTGWYRVAESIPLSDRHAGFILARLKEQAA